MSTCAYIQLTLRMLFQEVRTRKYFLTSIDKTRADYFWSGVDRPLRHRTSDQSARNESEICRHNLL